MEWKWTVCFKLGSCHLKLGSCHLKLVCCHDRLVVQSKVPNQYWLVILERNRLNISVYFYIMFHINIWLLKSFLNSYFSFNFKFKKKIKLILNKILFILEPIVDNVGKENIVEFGLRR